MSWKHTLTQTEPWNRCLAVHPDHRGQGLGNSSSFAALKQVTVELDYQGILLQSPDEYYLILSNGFVEEEVNMTVVLNGIWLGSIPLSGGRKYENQTASIFWFGPNFRDRAREFLPLKQLIPFVWSLRPICRKFCTVFSGSWKEVLGYIEGPVVPHCRLLRSVLYRRNKDYSHQSWRLEGFWWLAYRLPCYCAFGSGERLLALWKENVLGTWNQV